MKKLQKTKLPLRIIPAVMASLFLWGGGMPGSAFAQPKSLVGEIEFNEEVKDSPASQARGEVRAWVGGIVSSLDAAAPTAPAPLSDKGITYLNAVYLYCTIQKGTCPTVLEGLFEAEVLTALSNTQKKCALLPRFWRSWLNGGFEDRQKYQTKTGFLAQSSQFTNSVRPRYIKCDQTLTELFSSSVTFPSRFGPDRSGRQALIQFKELLQTIVDKGINVLIETNSLLIEATPAPSQSQSKSRG